MELWMLFLIGVLIGAVSGCGLSVALRTKTVAGTLREDRSDPNEVPYLFLELEPGGMEKIHRYKTVTLRVRIENYIPSSRK